MGTKHTYYLLTAAFCFGTLYNYMGTKQGLIAVDRFTCFRTYKTTWVQIELCKTIRKQSKQEKKG